MRDPQPAAAAESGSAPADPDPATAVAASAVAGPGAPAPTRPRATRARGGQRTSRRDELLAAAARLFAERGFRGVGIEQIGAAVGISGPAIYRHFTSKDAVLVELLVGISQRLLAGAQEARRAGGQGGETLDRLVRAHVEFALDHPELIIIHDRDLWSLPPEAAREVRRLQRAYTEQWVDVLRETRPELDTVDARARVHALFGLINSTPHSAHDLDRTRMSAMLHAMALGAARS